MRLTKIADYMRRGKIYSLQTTTEEMEEDQARTKQNNTQNETRENRVKPTPTNPKNTTKEGNAHHDRTEYPPLLLAR